ncbi:MAG: hypothetical protein U0325_17525 [Polyangiales bacterium]
MSLCPRCEFDLGEPPASANCPRCGVRVNARRRSLSGFSMPVAASASSTPSSPPKTASTPPRREVDDDSWGVSDEVQRAPVEPPAAPRAPSSVFRAPTQAPPRAHPEGHASDELSPHTRVLGGAVVEEALARRAELDAAAAPPPSPAPASGTGAVAVGLPRRETPPPSGSMRSTLVQSAVRPDPAVGRSTLILAPEEAPPPPPQTPPAHHPPPRATPLGFGAPAPEAPEPARGLKSTLVMSAPLDLAPPSAPRRDAPERGASTLLMAAAPPVAPAPPASPPPSPRPATTLVMAAPPEASAAWGNKSTLVMPTSLEPPRPASDPRPPAEPRPAPPPPTPAAALRPRLDLRPPTRNEAAALEDALVDESARDTVDPLAHTVPVEDLLADLSPPPAPLPPPPLVETAPSRPKAPPAPAVATAAPSSPLGTAPVRPSALATARVDALVSSRPTATRHPRAASRAARRLRALGGASALALLVAPWLAPMRASERAVAVIAGVIAAATAAAPRSSDAPGALAVALGTPLLGAWLTLTSDLSPLGLGLTVAVLLVLPGTLFHRGDRPESARGATLVGVGLALGAAWALLPAAGALLRTSLPPTLPREYATVALLPWLLLGAMSVPRATAGASGAPFAAGMVLWAGALATLRATALGVHEAAQWRVVAVTGVVAAAITALTSAGVARALDGDEA